MGTKSYILFLRTLLKFLINLSKIVQFINKRHIEITRKQYKHNIHIANHEKISSILNPIKFQF